MEFEVDKIEGYSSDYLQFLLDEMIDEWEKSNTVFSLTDLMEIVRELTLREGE
jgi:hypothetical protein